MFETRHLSNLFSRFVKVVIGKSISPSLFISIQQLPACFRKGLKRFIWFQTIDLLLGDSMTKPKSRTLVSSIKLDSSEHTKQLVGRER